MVPKAVTIATVEDELAGIKEYCRRHGWSVTWDSEALRLVFRGKHPRDATPIHVVAALEGYRALPPAWTFEDLTGGLQKQPFFPRRGLGRGGRGSIFHSSNTICAPFNRLAYTQHGGPHKDWGGPECWLHVKGRIRETNLAGMFASILGHLTESPGMK